MYRQFTLALKVYRTTKHMCLYTLILMQLAEGLQLFYYQLTLVQINETKIKNYFSALRTEAPSFLKLLVGVL